MAEEYREIVRSAIADEAGFIRATFSAKLRADDTPWVRIVVRPVVVKGRGAIQFSYFDPTRDITKNYRRDELERRLDEALAIPWSRIHIQTVSGDIHVRITRKGRALVARAKPSHPEQGPALSHDHVKAHILPADPSDAFLRAIGVTDELGNVRPGMQAKFRQVNQLVKIVASSLPEIDSNHAVRIVDCGCGRAYLTFAAYHYLSQKRALSVEVVGIDVNEELVAANQALVGSLGWAGLEFNAARISDYIPTHPPDLVLSLHACDTATDEAIARGILWGSRVILAAPCCQHELHNQLKAALFRPVTRHGILRERLADILTDAFRALVLRIMGYRTDVVEFVDPEHTAKNLLIRAEKGLKPGDPASTRQYQALKEFWNVTPCIEEMLGAGIRQHMR